MNAGIPVVNLNGTSAEQLISQRVDVVLAIENVIKLLEEMAPHGRDYPFFRLRNSYEVALATHLARCRALKQLAEEIENEALAIDKQGKRGGELDRVQAAIEGARYDSHEGFKDNEEDL